MSRRRTLMLRSALAVLAVLAAPVHAERWQTIGPDGAPITHPVPAGGELRQSCSCRPPTVGEDGERYRQCLCTAPSVDPPAADAPLRWLVQRAESDPSGRGSAWVY